MLPPLISLARKIRSRRMQRKLSQRAVAKVVGCSQSYIAHIECGRRPCSRAVAERLETLLGARRGSLTRFDFPRGRPPMNAATKHILQELRKAASPAERELPPMIRPPAFPRHDLVKPVEDAFWPMAIHLGERAAREVVSLEKQRREQDRFWRLANSLRYDSWSEKRLVVQLGLRCQQLLPLSLDGIGSQLRGVDGMSGKDTHGQAYPAFVLRHQDYSIAWFTQRCVRSTSGYRWPDAIVVVAFQGKKRTVVVEIDGPKCHRNVRQGEARDLDLGVPVLHVHPDVLGQPDGLDRILHWACAKIAS